MVLLRTPGIFQFILKTMCKLVSILAYMGNTPLFFSFSFFEISESTATCVSFIMWHTLEGLKSFDINDRIIMNESIYKILCEGVWFVEIYYWI